MGLQSAKGMSMKFGPLQLAWFGADDGAASIVTATEAEDPQITVDAFEKEIITSVYPNEVIYRGSKQRGGDAAMKQFRSHDTDIPLEIPLVFPKATGNEMRLYNSQQTGFSPNAGDVWFVYRRQDMLFVGSMPEKQWRILGTADPEDSDYQMAIQQNNTTPLDATVPNRANYLASRYPRSATLALQSLENAHYRCEYKPQTKLFHSRFTGLPYLEAHHLIPLFYTDRIQRNLDVTENIVALAPHWHRAIHHAVPRTTGRILDHLYDQRIDFLRSLQIEKADLLEIYGCLSLR